MSGVPRGSLLGPGLFNICVSNMDSGIECTLSKCASNTKMCHAVNTWEGTDVIQRDLDRLERWACANLVKFNKVEHPNQGNTEHKYRLDEDWIKRSPEVKDMGTLVNKKWCELAAQKSSHVLGCMNISMTIMLRKLILPSTPLS
ncbi:rna-directed dna polymerase from mobile element jockey-like [Pitangus sulphuratus]|nr:rna-directed dna polymerase from mobile element jockey-like [Pitangus sulphuratus]